MEGCLIRIIRPSGESTPKKRKQTQQELGSNIKVGCVCDAPSSPSLFLVPVEMIGYRCDMYPVLISASTSVVICTHTSYRVLISNLCLLCKHVRIVDNRFGFSLVCILSGFLESGTIRETKGRGNMINSKDLTGIWRSTKIKSFHSGPNRWDYKGDDAGQVNWRGYQRIVKT
jgi:hypothetical protein